MDSYVALDVEGKQLVTRNLDTHGRVAVHFPDLKRSVELTFDHRGLWGVREGPDAASAGEWTEVARGDLAATEQLMTLTEVVDELGVTRQTVVDWINKGYLPAERSSPAPRSAWRVKRSDMEKLRGPRRRH